MAHDLVRPLPIFETPVVSYCLYFLRNGMLTGSADIEARDDRDAERLARAMYPRESIEIWNDTRRLGVLEVEPN